MPNGLPAELLEFQNTSFADYFSGKDHATTTAPFIPASRFDDWPTFSANVFGKRRTFRERLRRKFLTK